MSQSRDARGEVLVQRFIELGFLDKGDNCCKLEYHNDEFHQIDVDCLGAESQLGLGCPNDVEPEL